MFLKAFGLLTPVAGGALWFAGVFHGAAYAKDVPKTPEEVSAALAALDMGNSMGGSESGFPALPPVQQERTADGFRWTLISGDQPAIVVTAHISPINGGAGTRLTATVEQGAISNPTAVSPEFRAPRVLEPIFAAALDAEMARLIATDPAAAADAEKRRQMAAGMTEALRIAANPAAMQEQFQAISEQMEAMAPDEGAAPAKGVRFVPGKPMVDVKR